jgi:O-antigen ligase
LVALHQDFWDAAGALFEHVPILGFGIRKLKQRL